jgi:hypothetical protein
MDPPTAKRRHSRGLTFEKAVPAERLAAGEIVTLDGHVLSATIDPDDPERVRLVVVSALGARPGEPPNQREIVISCGVPNMPDPQGTSGAVPGSALSYSPCGSRRPPIR